MLIFRSCSFGKQCEFVEMRDMQHGYFTEGDRWGMRVITRVGAEIHFNNDLIPLKL